MTRDERDRWQSLVINVGKEGTNSLTEAMPSLTTAGVATHRAAVENISTVGRMVSKGCGSLVVKVVAK